MESLDFVRASLSEAEFSLQEHLEVHGGDSRFERLSDLIDAAIAQVDLIVGVVESSSRPLKYPVLPFESSEEDL